MKEKNIKKAGKKPFDNRKLSLILAIAVIIATILFIEFNKSSNFGSSPALDELKSGNIVSPTDNYIEYRLKIASDSSENKAFTDRIEAKIEKYPKSIELLTDGYINTLEDKPITINELIGKKVILVDFWTYSCINCQRTTPYLNSWYERYKDKGLEIIGVHSPEFEFEKVKSNVEQAVKKFNITYPVAQDNDHFTFEAYQNRYWPRKYLIDIDGFIVYNHIGEGGYDQTEKKIKELLEEREQIYGMDEDLPEGLTKHDSTEVDPLQIGSHETYFGSSRNSNLGNGVSGISGIQDFKDVDDKKANNIYFTGRWNIEDEYAECVQDCGLYFEYLSKDVYLVAGSDRTTSVRMMIDGISDSAQSGEDNIGGLVNIDEFRLYKIVQGRVYSTHSLIFSEIQEGTRFYTFTFG